MDHFCLIFPDAVLDGKALRIIEKLIRNGVKLIDKSIRPLSLEEAKIIFYARRFEPNYLEFCKLLTITNVWLLRLRSPRLLKVIEKHIPEEYHGEFFIPADELENANFLTLIAESKDSKKHLKEIIGNIKQRVDAVEWQADLQFSAEAISFAQKSYSLYIAMIVAGFSEHQAFDLVLNTIPILSGTLEAFETDYTTQTVEDEDDDD